jgi:hypothetical protein
MTGTTDQRVVLALPAIHVISDEAGIVTPSQTDNNDS